MPRFAYVNGRYLRHAEASVHIEDRGYQFADGVYEVIHVHAGHLIDAEPHFERFDRSLGELRIRPPMSRAALRVVVQELLARNGIAKGIVYIQATRGVAPRDHKFPQQSRTSLVVTARPLKPLPASLIEKGAEVITIPDIRWQRCDIKAIALLPNVLGKQQAVTAGAFEAWQVDEEGQITEGTTTNAWIVTGDGHLVTRPLGPEILAGVVRRCLIGLLGELDIPFEQRAFSLAELRQAREAFLTGSSRFLLPVTRIDGQPVGDGAIGPISRELRRRIEAEVERQSAA
jgi:D-alanine transaminase